MTETRLTHFLYPFRSILCLLVLSGGLAACAPSGDQSAVHVEDLRYRLMPGGARILTGTLINDSSQHLTVAQVEVSLFDGDNRRISSMSVVVQDIAVGQQRDFRQPVASDLDVQGARVKAIILP
ncbi:MAG: hypothetical protein HKN13_08390 [Rhodothermales bacterium]|nr:hypothetical protein [Rhodothermales bacterium]